MKRSSFNGAASCGTRKALRLQFVEDPSVRFNGAASCGTRKVGAVGIPKQYAGASMGPRLVGRGKP